MKLVSLLLVSKRPSFLPVILGLIARQTWQRYEIVVVLHGYTAAGLDAATRQALAAAASVEEAPPAWSLGRCLNAAIRQAKGELLAKIDDDDLYGSHYLAEAVERFDKGATDIVGKCEFYIYLEGSRSVMLKHPATGLLPATALTGASLVFRRHLGEMPGFHDISLNESRLFVQDCLDSGARCFATSRRNFIVRRFAAGHDHTRVSDEAELLRAGILIRSGIADDSPLGLLSLIGG